MDGEQDYRRALGAFATGVALITADAPGGPAGLVVNSFTSVSLTPRLVLWCLGDRSDRFATFSVAERWGVSILADSHQALSARFAQQGSTASQDNVFERLAGAPVVDGAIARFVCSTRDRLTMGDHLVIVGAVEAFDTQSGDALTYFRGRYGVARTEG
ncbi:MAG: flavin reductase family protein [Hyphomonadaceae bacterium]|nr:MAG: flavin reductase [Caulobacteraceae bacterium]MBT9445232.1 flavin reductase family protein [Hyphomonadaceae bacterium]TPW07299.1 MAG: flavin reductase [Alphaproteobacteria bacterium]